MQLALEGIDGAGKSHVLSKVVDWLKERDIAFKVIHDVPMVKERLPEQEYAAFDKHLDMSVPDVTFFIYLAKSVTHYKREVLWEKEFPLSRVLVWDRSLLTPLVYSYYENYVFPKSFYIKLMKKFYDMFPKPDVTFVFLPPVEVCYNRVMQRENMKSYYRERDLDWLKETRAAYFRALDESMIALEEGDFAKAVLDYLEEWYRANGMHL